MKKIRIIKAISVVLLTVLMLLNSMLVTNIFAEGEENGNQTNETETQSNNSEVPDGEKETTDDEVVLLGAPANNNYKEVEINLPGDVPEDLVKPTSFAFYVKNSDSDYELNNDAVSFKYSYQWEDEYGFDIIVNRAIYNDLFSGNKDAKINIRFSDGGEKEFDVRKCIDQYCENNDYALQDQSKGYHLMIWAVPSSLVRDVRISFRNSYINLRNIGSFDGKWLIDSEDREGLIDEYFNAMYSNYESMSFSVEYYVGDTKKTISKESFIYGNINGIHGPYYKYSEDDGNEEGYIHLDNEPAIQLNELDSAEYVVDDETSIPFVYDEEKSTTNLKIYELKGDFDETQITDGEKLRLNMSNGENQWTEWYHVHLENYNDGLVLGTKIYNENSENPDSSILFIAKYTKDESYKETSFIDLIGDYDSQVFYNSDENSYYWHFYVDPADAYGENEFFVDATFVNNEIVETVEFEQILQDESAYRVPQTKGKAEDGRETVTLKLKSGWESVFTIKNKDNTQETQKHVFFVESRYKDILEYTYISQINTNGENPYIFDLGGLNNGIFERLRIDTNTEKDMSDLINTIQSLNPSTNYNDSHFEDNYTKIEFKEDVEIISKFYSIQNLEGRSIPTITYKVTKQGGVIENIVHRIFSNGDYSEGFIILDGNRYLKKTVEHEGQEYTVYIQDNSYTDAKTLLDYSDYRYNTIVGTFFYDRNTKGMHYDDGTFLEVVQKKTLDMYYVPEGVDIKNVDSLSQLTQVSLNKYIVLEENSEVGNTLSQAKSELTYRKKYASTYQNGNQEKTIALIENEDDFNAYTGEEPVRYLSIIQMPNNRYGVSEKIKTNKLLTTIRYSQHWNEHSVDNTKRGWKVDLTVGQGESVTDKINAALRGNDEQEGLIVSAGSTIELTSDITLDKDLIFESFYLKGAESDRNDYFILDLKGKTINTNGYKIEIPDSCAVKIINSADTQAHIIGNQPNTLIKNYGYLVVEGNIEIKNTNTNISSVGIMIYNDCFYTSFDKDVDIIASTGIKWTDRQRGHYTFENNKELRVGADITSTNRCIDVDLSKVDTEENTYRVLLQSFGYHDSSNQRRTLKSNKEAIHVDGSVILRTEAYIIDAAEPFVINGGKYTLNDLDVTARSGDIFLVDSTDPNASETRIAIILEGPYNSMDYVATGSIVREVATSNNSKIAKVSLESSNYGQVYFDYSSLFTNVPADKILINGGYYIKTHFDDPNVIDVDDYLKDKGYTFETVTHNGKDFVLAKRPQPDTSVSDFQQLKEALVNSDITRINVQGNIDGGNEKVIFEVGTAKTLELNGHTLSNMTLQAHVDDLEDENPNSGEFKFIGGTIHNSQVDEKGKTKPALIIDGAALRLYRSTVVSENSDAIILKNGDLAINDDEGSTIKGNSAVVVDIDSTRKGYKGNFFTNNATIIGLNGPAIRFDKTYVRTGGEIITLMLENSKVNVDVDDENPTDAPAIELYDNAHVMLRNSSVTGQSYAVLFHEFENNEGKSRLILYNGEISGNRAVKLGTASGIDVKEGKITASGDYAIETRDDSILEMYDGQIKASDGIVYCEDQDTTGLRKQAMRGGDFSHEVDKRWIANDGRGMFKYVCLQVEPINIEYPFSIVKQYTDIRVFQNISLSINRSIVIDQELFEGAISDAERKALEAEAQPDETGNKRVDIVFTIKPETSSENIDKIANNLPGDTDFSEYYDIHINKNVGRDKQRVEELSNYQVITMALKEIVEGKEITLDKNKVNIWHRHGNGAAKPLKKVLPPEEGQIPQEECYFITSKDGTDYVNVVTKRFSTFALVQGGKDIETETLKTNVSEPLNDLLNSGDIYTKSYSKGQAPSIPSTIEINGKSISTENITIAYEGQDKTVYYSESEFPGESGIYKVVWTLKEEVQDMTGTGSFEFTIKSSAPEEKDLTPEQKPTAKSDLNYSGNDLDLVAEPKSLPQGYEAVKYSIDGGTTWSDIVPQGNGAGKYQVLTKYIDKDGSLEDLNLSAIEVVINKKNAPSESELEDGNKPKANAGLSYDAKEHMLVTAPNVPPTGYTGVKYSTDGGQTWIDSVPKATNAGDYSVKVKYVDKNENHEEFELGPYEVKITKQAAPDQSVLSDDQKPTAVNNLKYDGTAKKLLAVPTTEKPAEYLKIEYSLDGNDWSAEIPSATAAGQYSVHVRYVGDINHENLTIDPISATIAPMDAPSADTLTDNQKPTAIENLEYKDENQNLVNKPESLPDNYDKVMYSTDGGKTWSESIPQGKEAGNYSIQVKYVDSSGNHADLIGNDITVSIEKAAAPDEQEAKNLPAENKPTANNASYSESGQPLVTAPKSLPENYVDVKYSIDGGQTWTDEIPTADAPGEYEVRVKYIADNNHTDFEGEPVKVEITKVYYPTREGLSWKKGSASGLEITFKSNYNDKDTADNLIKVEIDDKEISEYNKRSGSVVIVLNPSLLSSLPEGKHIIKAYFEDGSSETHFFIEKSSNSGGSSPSRSTYVLPKTGIE